MLGLFGRKRHERAGHALYTAAVQAARQPGYYTTLGAPDTIDGRFDMIGLHVFLIIDRLRESDEARALAQAVFDAMFADMDYNLREMGVGDMNVSKRNREMWEAFHGRATAYQAAFDAHEAEAPPPGSHAGTTPPHDQALIDAVARNVWRESAPPGSAETLAAIMRSTRTRLAEQPLDVFMAGIATFPVPAIDELAPA